MTTRIGRHTFTLTDRQLRLLDLKNYDWYLHANNRYVASDGGAAYSLYWLRAHQQRFPHCQFARDIRQAVNDMAQITA